MKISETKEFLKKVKVHYQDFYVEDYIIEEWHRILKDYSYEDVKRKFEEHLGGDMGRYTPKAMFLVRSLTKEDEKGALDVFEGTIRCNLCNRPMKYKFYDKHYEKCSSITYMYKQYKKFTGRELDTDGFYEMTDLDFSNKYKQFLEWCKTKSTDNFEKHCIDKALLGNEMQYNPINDFTSKM